MCLGQVWSVCRKDVERLLELCVGLDLPVSKRLLLSVFMRWRDLRQYPSTLNASYVTMVASNAERACLSAGEPISALCGVEQ